MSSRPAQLISTLSLCRIRPSTHLLGPRRLPELLVQRTTADWRLCCLLTYLVFLKNLKNFGQKHTRENLQENTYVPHAGTVSRKTSNDFL